MNCAKSDLRPLRSRPTPLGPQEILLYPHTSRVHWEVKQVRALAVALAQLCLAFPISVHLPRTAAGPEVLVGDDSALGLDDLAAHPLPSRGVL